MLKLAEWKAQQGQCQMPEVKSFWETTVFTWLWHAWGHEKLLLHLLAYLIPLQA